MRGRVPNKRQIGRDLIFDRAPVALTLIGRIMIPAIETNLAGGDRQ